MQAAKAQTDRSEAVETVTVALAGAMDLQIKRYCDGAVMLTQGDDRVYLSVRQFAALQNFITAAKELS